jgi:ACT domain-containing protein
MTMLADIKALKTDFGAFSDKLKQLGLDLNLQIHVMHEDIFNSMHRI